MLAQRLTAGWAQGTMCVDSRAPRRPGDKEGLGNKRVAKARPEKRRVTENEESNQKVKKEKSKSRKKRKR